MIYKYCFVVGKIVLFNANSSDCTRPTTALLGVCKAIHDEAEPYLYQNTIVFSTSTTVNRFFNVCLKTPERKFMVKSIELNLGQEDFTYEELLEMRHLIEVRKVNFYPETSQISRRRILVDVAHRLQKEKLRYVKWASIVFPVLNYTKLDHLVIDVGASICPRGCCDMPTCAIRSLQRGFALAAPKKVEVLSLHKVEMRDDARGILDQNIQGFINLWTHRRVGGELSPSEMSLPLLMNVLSVSAGGEMGRTG